MNSLFSLLKNLTFLFIFAWIIRIISFYLISQAIVLTRLVFAKLSISFPYEATIIIFIVLSYTLTIIVLNYAINKKSNLFSSKRHPIKEPLLIGSYIFQLAF